MMPRTTIIFLVASATALISGACALGSNMNGFTGTQATGATGAGNASTTGVGGSGTTSGTAGAFFGSGAVGTGTQTGVPCTVTDPNVDMDHDGWTPNQGDCNDCDPNVNPGAIDTPAHPGPDGGIIPAADNDCDGKITVNVVCDQGLALDDVTPMDGAKAIELCQTAGVLDKKWGVLSANYVRADGTVYTPATEVGLLQSFGPNVTPKGGSTMLALSSGFARTPGQPGACGQISCTHNGAGTAPTGFPQNIPNCVPNTSIFDDEALELQIRAPSNATGYTFNFKFHSFEYPTWVCTNYNDQFITLVSPAPMGSINGNISFDADHNPVSVNLGYFEVCDPASMANFASSCRKAGNATCPATPSPYCPSGLSELVGTGFDVWGGGTSVNGGATSWLQTSAPVVGASELTIRFTIWDTGNIQYDSTVLIDNFQWVATGGTVVTTTTPVQ
jgi:hypothetical protein